MKAVSWNTWVGKDIGVWEKLGMKMLAKQKEVDMKSYMET